MFRIYFLSISIQTHTHRALGAASCCVHVMCDVMIRIHKTTTTRMYLTEFGTMQYTLSHSRHRCLCASASLGGYYCAVCYFWRLCVPVNIRVCNTNRRIVYRSRRICNYHMQGTALSTTARPVRHPHPIHMHVCVYVCVCARKHQSVHHSISTHDADDDDA